MARKVNMYNKNNNIILHENYQKINGFSFNSGYIGASRSVRSSEAIDSYEVPISMITRRFLNRFLDNIEFYLNDIEEHMCCEQEVTIENIEFLKTVSVSKWKYVGKEIVCASSWHHTGTFYMKTDHYSLAEIAAKIIEMKDILDSEYIVYRKEKRSKTTKLEYGVIKVQVWGGTRKRPRLEGYDEVAGLIIGEWLYYKYKHVINGRIHRYKINANKVEWIYRYDSYGQLVKKHKKYKSSKCVFNRLAVEKGCK